MPTAKNTPASHGYCSWHKKFADDVALISMTDQGSGNGGSTHYACTACRNMYRLVPLRDMNDQTAAALANTAFIALVDHSVSCTTTACRPDPDRPPAPRPECPEAERLYQEWRQTERDGRT